MIGLFDDEFTAVDNMLTAFEIASLCAPEDRLDALGKLLGVELTDQDVTDLRNALSGWFHVYEKDTPAKGWMAAFENDRAPVYRALRIDPADVGAAYAIAPFRYMVIDGRHLIVAAYPCPRLFRPIDMHHLFITDVIAWDQRTDTAAFLGEDEGDHRLVGNLDDPARNTLSELAPGLYASPRTFFQHWAVRRAQWLGLREKTTREDWKVPCSEGDEAPGSLIVGDLGRIALRNLPDAFECVGIDPGAVNRHILRSANLPRALAGRAAKAEA